MRLSYFLVIFFEISSPVCQSTQWPSISKSVKPSKISQQVFASVSMTSFFILSLISDVLPTTTLKLKERFFTKICHSTCPPRPVQIFTPSVHVLLFWSKVMPGSWASHSDSFVTFIMRWIILSESDHCLTLLMLVTHQLLGDLIDVTVADEDAYSDAFEVVQESVEYSSLTAGSLEKASQQYFHTSLGESWKGDILQSGWL